MQQPPGLVGHAAQPGRQPLGHVGGVDQRAQVLTSQDRQTCIRVAHFGFRFLHGAPQITQLFVHLAGSGRLPLEARVGCLGRGACPRDLVLDVSGLPLGCCNFLVGRRVAVTPALALLA